MSESFNGFFRGQRVFLTGHTGFKGAWLAEWLLALGADVTGYSLPPPTTPSLFAQLGLEKRLKHGIGDINDAELLAKRMTEAQPTVVLHLAAQSLVRQSYAEPVETFATNVMGTVHVLEAVRALGKPCVVLCVTSDKCYENREWLHGYRESDPMGGYDPYSASKGCAELAIAAYRRSFFHPGKTPLAAVASARAGNVIGGGDWAMDRIVPDCMRALQRGQAITVRNPHATRPWQHVLEPLGGYLCLAERLGAHLGLGGKAEPGRTLEDFANAFNFGPDLGANRPVRELVGEVLKHWPGQWVDQSDPQARHEASLLHLAIDKAAQVLAWRPVLGFEQMAADTVVWYRTVAERGEAVARELTQAQIKAYTVAAQAAGRNWAG